MRTLILLLLIGAADLASAIQFQREDVLACTHRYKAPLGIQFTAEIQSVCENYTDGNLDCAINIMSEYGVKEYKPALNLCVMKFSKPRIQSCVIRDIGAVRRAGGEVNIAESTLKCDTEGQKVDVATQPRLAPPRPQNQSQPQIQPAREYLIEKISKTHFREQVSLWLNRKPTQIQNIDFENYFSGLALVAETAAIRVSRPVKLYKIRFNVGAKLIECTGTDFAPRTIENRPTNNSSRHLSLHECSVDENFQGFAAEFTPLNYGYLDKIPASFKAHMNALSRKWSGDGNISFRKKDSEFLVIGY